VIFENGVLGWEIEEEEEEEEEDKTI